MNLSKDELLTIAEMLAKLGVAGTPAAVQTALQPARPNASIKTFLRLPAVIAATGKSRSNILRAVKDGKFPAPVHVGPRAIAWDSEDLAKWQQARIDARQNAG